MQEFSLLIGSIYDTIVNPELWTPVLQCMCEFVGAARATLILEDAAEPSKSVFYASYSDAEWVSSYVQTYMMLNPVRLLGMGRFFAGDLVLSSDLITAEDYARTRFSREFLAQRDLVDIAVALLDQTATTFTVLSFKRTAAQGFADEPVRQRIALLAPHVKRAMSIGRVFETKRLELTSLSAGLDTLSGAVFLLNAAGTIVHANISARSLLASDSILREVGGVLVPQIPAARAELAEALRLAGQGDAALGTSGNGILFSVPPGKIMLGTLVPLTAGARRAAGVQFCAIAALCVRETTFAVPAQAAVLAQIYGLTPRELAVLLSCVEFGGVPETAAILGLLDSTIKSHLKSIFRKTHATRQADLVKLVAGVTMPVSR